MFWKKESLVEHEISGWILASFLSEAVETSQCYFFENILIKLKCPNLLKVLLPFFKTWKSTLVGHLGLQRVYPSKYIISSLNTLYHWKFQFPARDPRFECNLLIVNFLDSIYVPSWNSLSISVVVCNSIDDSTCHDTNLFFRFICKHLWNWTVEYWVGLCV